MEKNQTICFCYSFLSNVLIFLLSLPDCYIWKYILVDIHHGYYMSHFHDLLIWPYGQNCFEFYELPYSSLLKHINYFAIILFFNIFNLIKLLQQTKVRFSKYMLFLLVSCSEYVGNICILSNSYKILTEKVCQVLTYFVR